jgi:L-aspartate oxidase
MRAGKIEWWPAKVVVLATGGGGQVFSQTTNPSLSTGDGVAMAWRAGAQLRDLEFFQFHPTALTVPGAPRFLISEAVRGEGGHVVDDLGRRFLFDTHPAGELAPRDVVSRAIYTHLQATSASHVWLDLRPIPAEHIQKRFPKIIQVCLQWGIDVFSQPIPVAPAAHYWMGGIVTDLQAATSIPGLYAVGEVTSTGVHGANRLASNSLLECLVFAAQLSELVLPELDDKARAESREKPLFFEVPIDFAAQLEQIYSLRQQIPELMWQSAGIARQEETMAAALAQVAIWRQEWQHLVLTQMLAQLTPERGGEVYLPEPEQTLRLWSETQNLLDIAWLILKSAQFRTESRGGHYRSDYPQTLAVWQVHTLVQNQNWQQSALGAELR